MKLDKDRINSGENPPKRIKLLSKDRTQFGAEVQTEQNQQLDETHFIKPTSAPIKISSTLEKKNALMRELDKSKLRVMSKQRWIQCKNRYRQLLRTAYATTTRPLPLNIGDLCKAVRDRLRLSTPAPVPASDDHAAKLPKQANQKQQYAKRRMHQCPSNANKKARTNNNSLVQAHTNHSSNHHVPKQVPAGSVAKEQGSRMVRITLATFNAKKKLDADKLHKGLCALFDKQGNESALPHSREFAFINVVDCVLLTNGVYKPKCYISTYQLESASKLLSEQGRNLLARLVGPRLKLEEVRFLSDREVVQYGWKHPLRPKKSSEPKPTTTDSNSCSTNI